ncbi:hypothetical protein CPB85DRAFT_1319092 [Mucidula mucida]|nr:hypothetical protein CPB85DRAFT_1319092 [Mucidula mucida]
MSSCLPSGWLPWIDIRIFHFRPSQLPNIEKALRNSRGLTIRLWIEPTASHGADPATFAKVMDLLVSCMDRWGYLRIIASRRLFRRMQGHLHGPRRVASSLTTLVLKRTVPLGMQIPEHSAYKFRLFVTSCLRFLSLENVTFLKNYPDSLRKNLEHLRLGKYDVMDRLFFRLDDTDEDILANVQPCLRSIRFNISAFSILPRPLLEPYLRPLLSLPISVRLYGTDLLPNYSITLQLGALVDPFKMIENLTLESTSTDVAADFLNVLACWEAGGLPRVRFMTLRNVDLAGEELCGLLQEWVQYRLRYGFPVSALHLDHTGCNAVWRAWFDQHIHDFRCWD